MAFRAQPLHLKLTARACSQRLNFISAAAAGELAIKAQPEELAAVAMPVLERLVPILSSPLGHMPRSILENSAITLGRCACLLTSSSLPAVYRALL